VGGNSRFRPEVARQWREPYEDLHLFEYYQDLIEHRAAAERTRRRMGHDVIGMEQYVAEGKKPVDRCLADVKLADLYVVIGRGDTDTFRATKRCPDGCFVRRERVNSRWPGKFAHFSAMP
jgi:hypothetical protein